MRRIIMLAIILLILSVIPNFALATEYNLIEDMQISLKSTENPNRLEISFDLTEPINLSQGNSNIIFEYFSIGNGENLEAMNYKKDKSWSGYLNSYDNYPAGERKYSSGNVNENYSDNVPATKIYTSTKTNANIDVTSVTAVIITVLRVDGSGEKITIHTDGTISNIEEIGATIVDQNKNMGIVMEPITSELPIDTILIANELTSGSIYEKVSSLLTDAKDFIAIDITLESNGNKIQPDGKVKFSVPIPEYFNNSNLVVYRIDDYGAKIPYSVTITTNEGIEYATFEADHFSIYVLAAIIKKESEIVTPKGTQARTEAKIEENAKEEKIEKVDENVKEETIKEVEENGAQLGDTNPQTGAVQSLNFNIAAVIISVLALLIISKQKE